MSDQPLTPSPEAETHLRPHATHAQLRTQRSAGGDALDTPVQGACISVSFFEASRHRIRKSEADAPAGVEHGFAGDLAAIMKWLGSGYLPIALTHVTVSRDASGQFTRTATDIEFPYHRDDWDHDDFYLSVVRTLEDLGYDCGPWRSKMTELRGLYAARLIS